MVLFMVKYNFKIYQEQNYNVIRYYTALNKIKHCILSLLEIVCVCVCEIFFDVNENYFTGILLI